MSNILRSYCSIISCINNFKHDNTFGAYAMFWYDVGFNLLIQNGVFSPELAATIDVKQLGFAYLEFLILVSMETHKVLFTIFIFINFLFIELSLSSFGIMEHTIHSLAAYSEMAIALVGFYGCGASVLNTHFRRVFLQVGKSFGI